MKRTPQKPAEIERFIDLFCDNPLIRKNKLSALCKVSRPTLDSWFKDAEIVKRIEAGDNDNRPIKKIKERHAVHKRVLETGDPKGAMFLAQVVDGHRAGADVRVGGGVEILTAEYIAAVEKAAEEKLKNNGIS